MSQNNLRQQQLKCFKIEISSKYIKIVPLIQEIKTQILIQKKSSKILLADKNVVYQQKQSDKQIQCRYASLIIGVIFIENEKFLVYARSVYPQGVLPASFRIYQIAQVQFIPFTTLMSQTKQMLQIMEKVFNVQICQQIFSFSFYFSFNRDLTLSFQQFYDQKVNKPKTRYFWNYEMLNHLVSSQSGKQGQKDIFGSEWCIPVIQGYFNSFQYKLKQDYEVQVFLISRRSKHRSGTRFYNRGIDESGRCANFIETQVALLYNKTLMSTRYYSGSVPLFWEQTSQLSRIKLTRDRDFTGTPFKKHMKQLVAENQHIMLINLLQKKKENQHLLIKEYEYQVHSHSKPQFEQSLRYAYFDLNFHDKTKQHQKVWEFIEGFMDLTEVFKSFQINLKTNVVYSTQRGAYRVSCLDCLARTNRLLEILAFQALYINLEKISFFKQSFKELSLQLLSSQQQKMTPFLRYYKSMWQQKAQFQSIIYAGSPSTHGKKTKLLSQIQSTLISLQRYYNQKFIDQVKQRSLDCILYHKNYEPLFRLKHRMPFTVSILTWNINATQPQKMLDLPRVFKYFQKSDLIVIGFQQMIELNTNNLINDNTSQSKNSQMWKNYIDKNLAFEKAGEYIFVQKVEMIGLFLIMFISKKWIHSLRAVNKDIVKTGMRIGVGDKYGNKGGIIIRITIFETTLTFVCAHLAAHQNKVKERVSDFVQIHKKAFQQNKQSIQNQLQIEFSDYKFFFGDLNFRLNGQFSHIKQMIQFHHEQQQEDKNSSDRKTKPPSLAQQKICQQLMLKDQLYQLMNNLSSEKLASSQNDTQSYTSCLQYFSLYKESQIGFFPTYKLDKQTGEYTLQKNRNPSYCDRILFWKNYDIQELNIEEEQYSDIRIKGSDHRPVYGRFVVNILKQTRKNSHSIIVEESCFDSQSQAKQDDMLYGEI